MYQPTLTSVRTHPLPAWYGDAKLGIFIHWGLFSVPAFAPSRQGDFQQLLRTQTQDYFFTHQPYAEWYWNSLRIAGSPVQRYHAETYGADYPYTGFIAEFNRQSAAWDPQAWVNLFRQAGARYVVLVTKHHDGFLLWPSHSPNPHIPYYRAERDIVGELTGAVRQAGLKMGHYYSSALDWTFTAQPIRSFADLLLTGSLSSDYRRYILAHWHELIERYQSDILWSDIGYPDGYNLNELFAHFYNKHPEGVVNDRWLQVPGMLRNRLGRWLLNTLIQGLLHRSGAGQPQVPHCDFSTAEYAGHKTIQVKKWEACRGIGNSFGYNQMETSEDYLKPSQLIPLLIDIVSKNGNLLLNVGPRPDGSLPEAQIRTLQGLGDWLGANGAAIYGTRPWLRPSDALPNGGQVHYTTSESTLYVHLTTPPPDDQLALSGISLPEGGKVSLLATSEPLSWHLKDNSLLVDLPPSTRQELVPVLRLEGYRSINS